MTKIKKDKGLTLEIDQAIVDALCIDEKTNLQMAVIDNMLIITVKDKDILKKQQKRRDSINQSLMDQYAPVLKKLAKT